MLMCLGIGNLNNALIPRLSVTYSDIENFGAGNGKGRLGEEYWGGEVGLGNRYHFRSSAGTSLNHWVRFVVRDVAVVVAR